MSPSLRPARTLMPPSLRSVRPSVLEPLLPHEPWLGACCCVPNVLVLYVENRPVSLIQGTPLDRAALESRLFSVRSQFPRRAPHLVTAQVA